MRRLAPLAVAAVLASGPVLGQGATVDYGQIGCAAWTEMRGAVRNQKRTKIQAWLTRSVISGWNAPLAPGSDAGLDYAGLFGMVDVYCRADPGKTLKDVTEMLIEEMDSR
jgi:hypothetical protein